MSSTQTETTPEPDRTRFAKDQLKAFVERIERLEEEKKAIADDIRDVYAESKSNGFDVKALRAIITLRKQDAQERSEHELILETYMNALGMLPLFERDPPRGGGSSGASGQGSGAGSGGAPPKSGAKHAASMSADESSRGGDGVAPTCLGRDGPERASLALAPEEAPGPRDIELNLSHAAIAESEAGGRSPTLAAMGPVLPPVTWREPSLVEIDLTEIPPELLRGNAECWVSAHGPPEVRPP